ncbi:hypothetical protein BST97_06755 [Nonlabens spongiae]|uniref:YdbS-like PH domain-containing protein n=1 Tax=Nonlabens spongiae TaxID=331648 RepID=A0A1W6MJF4_9FLAO|nr:PH domain-containing protein [Nonlabens spongiae]ARN77720.1 hypothetical protein BST97_06755 [Nonlabens spongiae]
MLNLSTPRRQSKLSILLYLFKGLKGIITYVVFGYLGSQSMGGIYFLYFTIFIAVMALVGPFINYWFFKFHIENDEFIINKGWLNKEKKAVPLERIQSININQNLIQRILGIAALEVETAGSKAKELEIPGLQRSFARELKNYLNEKKQIVVDELEIKTEDSQSSEKPEGDINPDATESHVSNHQSSMEKKTESLEILMQLDFLDLLKVGFTQNHLRSGFVALGVVSGFWFQIKDLAEDYFKEYTDQVSIESAVRAATLQLLIVTLVAFLIISVLVSLVTVINKFWGFKMVKQYDYLEVSMGLFNRTETKVPLNKIQLLEFHSNPLRKLLGFHTGKIFQAQSENNRTTSIQVPACKREQILRLQSLIFGKLVMENAPVQLHSNPWSHLRLQFYITGVISIVAMICGYYFDLLWLIVAAGIFLPYTLFMAYQYGKYSRVNRDDEYIVFYKGWLFNSIIISPIYKTQAVEKWRSIFLKRRRECHINIHTAAGSRGLKYLKDNQVSQFINQVNNQVLVENRPWM